MKIRSHVEIFSTVNKRDSELLSETLILGNNLEAKVTLVVNINSFLIKNAYWEIHKAPTGVTLGHGSTEILNGELAHIEGRKQLKKLLSMNGGVILEYLFSDCVKSLIQAETFVWAERGFESEKAYEKYWDHIEENGCRAYSHPDSQDPTWMVYSASNPRQNNLFNRCRHYMFIDFNDLQTSVIAGFNDSYHELGVSISMSSEDLMISKCDIDFVRAPMNACYENFIHGEKFEGKSILKLEKKEIIDLAGRCYGCYHLVDLITDVSAIARGKGIFSNNFGC